MYVLESFPNCLVSIGVLCKGEHLFNHFAATMLDAKIVRG